MRLAWATDIHLNFLTVTDRRRFIESFRDQMDALVISGDIAESNNIVEMLRHIDAWMERPVYFVLGNHDCYRGSVAATRANVSEIANGSKNLLYLSEAGVVKLTPNTCLVGHDGWADARLGEYDTSDVIVNDFLLIDELRCWKGPHTLDKTALRQVLQALGDEAAEYLKRVLALAAEQYPNLIVATHVPPFRETAWHQGRPSGDDYLPYFSCKAVGDVLLAVAKSHPACQLLVLCGHTHGGGEVQVLDNLRVVTGPAEYGKPEVQRIIEVE